MNRFLLIAFLASGAAQAAPATLSEVFRAAAARTESVPIAESQLREADAVVSGARADFLPTIAGSATYQRQEKEISSINSFDQTTGKLTLSQSLLNGLGDKADLDAAKANRSAKEYNLASTRNALYASVARVYYGLLSALREVSNTQRSIDLAKERIKELNRRKKIGKTRDIEVLAADAQLAVLEAQLLAAHGARRIAKNNFANVTGLDRDLELEDTAALPTEKQNLRSFRAALDSRPDILSLRASVLSDEYAVKSAFAGHLPTLDLSGNYYLYRQHKLTSAADWDAQLVLSLPLFSGGAVQSSVRQAVEQKTQSELLLNQRLRDSDREIHTAYNNLTSSIEQVKALERALAATEKNYKQQEKDYRYSLATNLDVLQALNTFHDTKRSLDRTRYQALIALAELKAAANQVGE